MRIIDVILKVFIYASACSTIGVLLFEEPQNHTEETVIQTGLVAYLVIILIVHLVHNSLIREQVRINSMIDTMKAL